MRQILHIFIKDTRHLWIEVLISIALTAALVVMYPKTWSFSIDSANVGFTNMAPADSSLSFLATLMLGLIPLNWWFLIARVVHAEGLVGDRQFWLTRPYRWKTLLASKLLFVAIFIYGPYLIAQSLLLVRAGFNPGSYLAGLLLCDLWMTVILILPVVAIATVTATTSRAILAVLGALLYIIALSALSHAIPATLIDGRYGFFISSSLMACLCLAVVINQYRTRATRLSWILLIGLMLLVAGVTAAAPDQARVNRDYPSAGAGELQPLQLSYRTADPGYQPSAYVTENPNEVGIALPVMESGVPEHAIVIPDALRVAIDASDGTHWTSVWLPLNLEQFNTGQRIFLAGFHIPRKVYDRLLSLPLSLHLRVAFKEAKEGAITRLPLPANDFSIPGFGICRPTSDFADRPDEIRAIVCRAALRPPALTRIEATWSEDPCGQTPAESRPGIKGTAWEARLKRAWGASIWFQCGCHLWAFPVDPESTTSANTISAIFALASQSPSPATNFSAARRCRSPSRTSVFQLSPAVNCE
jgi:hypothetical protein